MRLLDPETKHNISRLGCALLVVVGFLLLLSVFMAFGQS